jgi:hypothetical protein
MQTERRFVRVHKLLFAALLTLGHVRAAHAEPEPRAEARAHYERGLALAESHAYDAALAEFDRAYAKSPHYAVLYNMGLCQVGLGRSVEAVDAFSKYLAEGGAQVPASRRAEVEAQIAQIESRLAELSISSDRPGTRVFVDGREVGRTPLAKPVRVAAGAHEISADFEGTPAAKRTIELREAERRSVDFTFAASPSAPPPALPPSPPPASLPPPLLGLDYPAPHADSTSNGTWRTVGYVLTGAGVVAGAGGLAHYFWNRTRYDDWQTEQASLQNGPPSPGYHDRAVANNEQADSIENASAVTVGLFVASGVFLASGITLIVVDPGSGASVAWSGTW